MFWHLQWDLFKKQKIPSQDKQQTKTLTALIMDNADSG